MRVIAKKVLRDFWGKNIDSEQHLKIWYKEASKAQWNSPNEIKDEYARVSILKSGRVVFDICGIKYRLIADINYERKWVFIRFIGTHNEYDKVDANNI
ncbi:MAG: addiction module toxin RelE [Bacteroidetes bacterium GWF2_49_14]|nr:MAG: addiction module toxin RelE [Bacteroidetes bacterium GWF2_49_14]HBB93190.1 addiction module toxin RelE [Bacteroidales bacterium]